MAIRTLRIRAVLAFHRIEMVPPIVLLLLLASPLSIRAEGRDRITLRVGERKTLGGYAPICDDPAVAIISAEGGGVLVARGEGKTTCSVQQPGGRRIVEVVVLPREDKAPKGGA